MSTNVETKLITIQEKINNLSSRVDSQLTTKDDLSDTLRSSLRGCISLISDTLNELESVNEEENAILNWFGQKKKLVKKRTQLENMLQATGKFDLQRARAEIGEEDSDKSGTGTSGQKRQRKVGTASSLFSGRRSIGERDKAQKGSLLDIQFGNANDLLSKLDEESSSEDSGSGESSSTDDLENLLAEKPKSKKDDLLSLLGDKDSSDDSTDGSSTDEEDDLSKLLESSKTLSAPVFPSKKKTASPPTSIIGWFTPSEKDKSEQAKKFIGTGGTEIIDASGLTKALGQSEDTNVAGYRRKKKKGRYFALEDEKGGYEMQDTHVCVTSVVNNGNIYCVFDGHSKALCSQRLKEIFPEFLRNHVSRVGLSSDLTHMWEPLYEEVDSNLIEFEECGATGTTVFIWKYNNKRYIQSANVGDSFSFLYRAGQPISLSVPHRLSNPDERQRLVDMGEEIAPNQTRLCGLNVTRVLGDHFGKSVGVGIIGTPYVSPVFELCSDDTHMIVASDGLWDVIDENEAWELIKDLEDAQDMSQVLMKTALRDPECTDNITVVVVKLV